MFAQFHLAWDNIWKHPKSTLMSTLSLVIALVIAISDLPKEAKWTVIVASLAKAMLGWLSKDPSPNS